MRSRYRLPGFTSALEARKGLGRLGQLHTGQLQAVLCASVRWPSAAGTGVLVVVAMSHTVSPDLNVESINPNERHQQGCARRAVAQDQGESPAGRRREGGKEEGRGAPGGTGGRMGGEGGEWNNTAAGS